MADNNTNDSIINGVNGETEEFFDDTSFPPLKTPPTPSSVDVDRLNKRIADLDRDNSESESRIAGLKFELEKLRVEKDAELGKLRVAKKTESERSESNSKAAEEIAKRASELEGEVARLQHDLISAMNDSSESTREIQKLTSEIAELKKEKSELEGKVINLRLKMEELVKKSEESDDLISGFMQKIEDREIKAVLEENGETSEVGGCGGGILNGLRENLGLIGAASGGVVLAGGIMCYVRHSRN